jgi:twitching motility protein PilU
MSDTPNMVLDRLLSHMVTLGASDLYLTVGSPPVYRVDGVGRPGKHAATVDELEVLTSALLTPEQRREFDTALEMNVAVSRAGQRFRANVFRQRGAIGIVFRLVRSEIRTIAQLGHPSVLARIAEAKRGLVLVVGGTGSGKSTTLAAMIDHRNSTATGHIVTVEDPMEFVHPHKKCVVTQREVGVDTHSYADALKSALRQAPDVVLIGEIRDRQTMEAALAFAETGHLCLSTLHANNANEAIERVLNFFPADRQAELLHQLSLSLRAVVSQRLVPDTRGGRAAALEILLDTPRVKDLVKKRAIDALKDAMEQSAHDGCQTFDAALLELVKSGRVAPAEALAVADSPNNLRLKLQRSTGAEPRTGGGLRLLDTSTRRRAA